MLENVLYLLSEISLLLGVLVLLIQKMFTNASIRSYFKTTKITVMISAFFSILFYNKVVFPSLFDVSSYTVLFYVLSALIMFAWLSLSIKWFISEDIDSCLFCILSIIALLGFDIVIKAIDVAILFCGLVVLSLVNYRFLKFSDQSEEFHNISTRYLISVFLFMVLMVIALCILGYENWSYNSVAEFIGLSDVNDALLIICAILFFVLFLLNVAPLHFCFADVVAYTVLPVAAYLNLVPIFALFAVFVKLNTIVFTSYATELNFVYSVFGIVSLIFGAIGANSSRNLRKIFAYSSVYNLGIMLLLVSPFNSSNLLGGFIYLQVYVLALFGIYTSFYSFKSNGVYLTNLNMINGIAKVRPFISAAMLFFMISLMGISPFPGFIGQLSALESFVASGSYGILFTALFCMIILMSAYLQIIRSIYFNDKEVEFNRPDYGVYVYLMINMVLIAILIFRPEFLLYDAPAVLNLVLR